MTVPVTNAWSGPYVGDGATTAFPFTFRAMGTEYVGVRLDGAAQTAGFTVALNANGIGGTVTMATAPAAGVEVVPFSSPSFRQDVSFQNAGPFLPETHDEVADEAAVRDIYLRNITEDLRADLTDLAGEVGAILGPLVVTGVAGQSVSSRLLLAAIGAPVAKQSAILTEASREGAFVFDSSDLSAEVAADTRQGIFVAPSSDTTGASGAWVRKFDGPVQAHWFGTVADGSTDDYAAINEALGVADMIGRKQVRIRGQASAYALATSLDPPSGLTITGDGKSTVLKATNAADQWLFFATSKSNIVLRDMKLTPYSGGSGTRSAIQLNSCSDCKIENITVEDVTDANGVFLIDCDRITVDGLYFDGGGAGNGVYNSGGRNCKVVDSHAVDCFAGFAIASEQTDFNLTPVATTRTVENTWGNTIANCTVRDCTTQSYTITGAVANTISGCHAEDYAGASTHKAFQVKDTTGDDPAGDSTRGNVFSACTVKNYPAGFGGQESSHTQFIGCTTRDNSTNAFELNAMSNCQFIGCAAYEFGQAGILLSKSSSNKFNGFVLETSTATAIGIKDPNAGASQSNNFDNITTFSTLAKFIDIASGSNNNRFGLGCRSNGNPISDASSTSVWPVVDKTDIMDLSVAGQVKHGARQRRGLHVVVADFVVTETISGSPEVQAGGIGSIAAIAASQAVTGAAGAVVNLTKASETLNAGLVVQGRVNVTGTGAGFIQFEGLPRL